MPPLQPDRNQKGKVVDLPKGQEVLGHRRLELIGHAVARMKTRQLTVQDVLHAIRCPSETGLPTQAGRHRVRWNKTTRSAVDVVYDILPDRIRVITTFVHERRIVERKNDGN